MLQASVAIGDQAKLEHRWTELVAAANRLQKLLVGQRPHQSVRG